MAGRKSPTGRRSACAAQNRLCLQPGSARRDQLSAQAGQLLIDQRILADIDQAILLAELLDRPVGRTDSLPQLVELGAQPLCSLAVDILLVLQTSGQVELGEGVHDPRCQFCVIGFVAKLDSIRFAVVFDFELIQHVVDDYGPEVFRRRWRLRRLRVKQSANREWQVGQM